MDNMSMDPIKTRHAVLCDATCAACAYMSKLGSMMTCDYLLVTGHRRGCPPGRGCTRRVVGGKMQTIEQQIANGRIDRAEQVQADRERARAYGRAYYERHKEEVRAKQYERYHALTPEEKRARQPHRKPLTPDQRRAKRARMKARCGTLYHGEQKAAISAYRTEHGLSQRELAEQLGVHRSTLQNWEQEKIGADWSILGKLGITLERRTGS